MKTLLIIIPTVLAALIYRAFVFLVFISFLPMMAFHAEKNSIQNEFKEHKIFTESIKQKPVAGAKGWALGCAAMLIERNHGRHDILATGEITLQEVAIQRRLLRTWWDVKNRNDLLDTLDWLDNRGGHRKDFERIGKSFCDLSEEEFQSRVAQCGNDMEKKQELIIARKYYKQLGDKSIKGWDYTRYIAVCRWGYTSGYIREKEAWDKIMPAASKLQKTFDSWEDLGQNYIIGRQFWSYSQTQSSGHLFTETFERLKNNPESPWNKYPWDMNLESPEN